MRQPTMIELAGILVFIVMPLGAIGAFGMVAVIAWAVSDIMHYGILMFALGVGLGRVSRWQPSRASGEEIPRG